jgi:hypothetical protein
MSARLKYPKKNYPFSNELCEFMDKEPDFYNSLKIVNTNNFIFIPIIITSHTPVSHQHHNDEVIGMWYYDKNNNTFKQDFIVNKDSANKEFVSYTAQDIVKRHNSNHVQIINKFFDEYGESGKYYHNGSRWQHHYKNINELPQELRKTATILTSNS